MSFKSLREKARSTAQNEREVRGVFQGSGNALLRRKGKGESRYTMHACQEYLAPLVGMPRSLAVSFAAH